MSGPDELAADAASRVGETGALRARPEAAARGRADRVSPGGLVRLLVASMRPHQWTKNVFVFAALIFAHKLGEPAAVLRACAAFALFCFLSGAVYIVNDLVDREKDRTHERKRLRPIASGRLAPGSAGAFAVILTALSLGLAFLLSAPFAATAAAYLCVNLLYSFYLKRFVIIDVMTIALGFVLRAVAGAAVVAAPISSWLVLCTSLLALFLGFCKRRGELTLLQSAAGGHREILREYSVSFLDHMISVVTASTVIAYAFYAMSPEVQGKLHTHGLGLTVPFVLYGIFRYLYLLHVKGEGGSPSRTLLEDAPLLINVVLWGITCVVLLYFKI